MKLGEFVTLQRGYDLPDERRVAGEVPVIGSFGITGWHNEARSRGPGVTVGRSGASFGTVSYSPIDFWPLNTALYVINFHGNDPKFTYYFLKTFDFVKFNSGSAQPSLNRNFIHPVEVCVPPSAEQIAIAGFLASLDDKIELNRRMAETLQAMARALFQSWFVDFDPVRAKAEGRPTGLPDELAGLFPDSFEEDRLPIGWSKRSVYDFARIIFGAPFASSKFNNDSRGLPLIRVRDLGIHDPAIFTDEQHRVGHVIQPGEIVVGMDGEFRCHLWRGPPAYLNQRLCHFEPLPNVPKSFVTLALVEPLAAFEASAVGTTVIHLGKKDLDAVEFIWPGKGLLHAFGNLSDQLLDRAIKVAQQSRTLAVLRDTLLPKLISGELRIADAEKRIAAA